MSKGNVCFVEMVFLPKEASYFANQSGQRLLWSFQDLNLIEEYACLQVDLNGTGHAALLSQAFGGRRKSSNCIWY